MQELIRVVAVIGFSALAAYAAIQCVIAALLEYTSIAS